jgi:hypothetical protein
MEKTYRGFVFDYDSNTITFCHRDLEDGSGDWSGIASTLKDAYEQIDEMLEEIDESEA